MSSKRVSSRKSDSGIPLCSAIIPVALDIKELTHAKTSGDALRAEAVSLGATTTGEASIGAPLATGGVANVISRESSFLSRLGYRSSFIGTFGLEF